MIPKAALNFAKTALVEKLAEMRTASKIAVEHIDSYFAVKKAPESVTVAFREIKECCDANLTRYTALITSVIDEFEKHDEMAEKNEELQSQLSSVMNVISKMGIKL